MALLNNTASEQAKAAPTPHVEGTKTPAEKEAQKKANEKKLKERRKAEKTALLAYLRKVGNLPADIEAIVSDWEKPRAGGGAFGEPLFNKIFGATPKVGDKVSLQDVFNKTFKGVDKMNELMKKWRDKGTAEVEYVHNASAPLQSQYVIKKIG